MAVSNIFAIHGVVAAAVDYTQITDGSVSPESEILTALPSGHYQPLYRAVQSQQPMIEFTTTEIARALAQVGLDGVDINGASNLDLFEKKVVQRGTREADASVVHNRYRCNEAFLYAASISAAHNGTATARMRGIPNYDGSVSPIVPAGSVALGGTSDSDEQFGAGPVQVNGTAYNGVQQIDIDFGVVLYQEGGESDIWDTFVAVQEIVPFFTITCTDTSRFLTLTEDGLALSGDGFECWLRKYSEDGTRVANGTAEHIKFTCANGIAIPESVTGDGRNNRDTLTFTVYPSAASATVDTITIDETSTIA